MSKGNGRLPDYRLKALDKTTDYQTVVGAGWLNPNGSVSIKLNPCVKLEPDQNVVLTLFPCEKNEK